MPPAAAGNPLTVLTGLGQSVWLEFTTRNLIRSRELERLIREDSVRGMTTHPTIFERAIAGGSAYDADIIALAEAGMDSHEIFTRLMVDEVQEACDVFGELYESSHGREGFVSLEVSPALSDDAAAMVKEARQFWSLVERRNLMLRIPATRAGVVAMEECLALGINVNATLVLSLRRYRAVRDAFLASLGARRRAGLPLEWIASVASCPVSRVDIEIDHQLELIGSAASLAVRGRAGIANAALIYEAYANSLRKPEWRTFANDGALSQRLLWSSTTMRDPNASPLRYCEALIAPTTATTMAPETLLLYRTEGQPEVRLDEAAIADAHRTVAELAALGISIERTAARVGKESVERFAESWESLQHVIERKASVLAARA